MINDSWFTYMQNETTSKELQYKPNEVNTINHKVSKKRRLEENIYESVYSINQPLHYSGYY